MAGGSLLRTVLTTTRSLRTVVKDAGRAREIAGILAKYGFAAALDNRARKRERRRMIEGEAGTSSGQDLMQRGVAMLEELGPTFVKFGQILSTRPDVIPPEMAARLQSLQDHVATVPLEQVKAQIVAALGADPADLFATFDDEPIASASIAQVHGATTHEGDDVVVKVQRPNIRPTIESDLSLLRFLAQQVLDVFPEARTFDIEGMVREFEKSLKRELDFTIEQQSLSRFAENFRDKEDRVHIPHVFKPLCSQTVLTMERVRGQKLTALKDPVEQERVAYLYLDAAYQMLFHDGFFHGDLHPGNVFLEPDGRLGLIDFGMVGRLSRSMREKVVDVIFSVLREDLEGVARVWYSIGTPHGRMDYANFEADVVEVLEQSVVGRAMEDIDIGGFLQTLLSVSVRHRMQLPSDFTMMFKAMVTTEGLARQVMQGINPVEAARPYIETLIKDRYSVDRLKATAVTELIYAADLARALPGRVDRLLHQLEAGDISARVRLDDLDGALTRIVRARNRESTAIVIAASALTGALTLDKGTPFALGLPPVTLICFTIAAAGLVWLSLGILRGR